MARQQIPFPTQTSPGGKLQEAGGRIFNGYVEQLGDAAPYKTAIRRMPGLVNFGTTTRTGYRGSLLSGGVLYSAFATKLESHTSAGGASTTVGNLNGTKRGFFSANGNATPDKFFTDPDGNIATFTTSTVTNGYPDPDLPTPNSLDFLDGYTVFTIADGRFFATDLNSTSVNALSFGKAASKPYGLTLVKAWGGRLLVCGPVDIEVWTDQATVPFPFARAVVIPRGIAGPYCMAGTEDGFSRGPIWVADDNRVYALNGYTPQAVSTPDLDTLIEAVTDKTTLETTTFMSHGHAFFQLSCPAWTWILDVNTSQWFNGDSYLATRSRRSGALYAFSKWLTGDVKTGNIQQITETVYDEVGDPYRLRIESGPVMNFPAGAVVGRADFYFATGVGIATGLDPIQTDPDVEISYSDDGGQTWSNPILRKLGRQATPQQLISLVACTGKTSWIGRRWRIDISNPVYASLLFATQDTDPRAR
jgi:hypothetical protein